MFEYRSTLAQRAILLALALVFAALCYQLARNARTWGPELSAVNRLFNVRGPRPVRNDFLIVGIGKDRLDDRGRVSRGTLAALVRRAKAGGARAVVLDVYMPNRTTRAADRNLWLAIASTPQNVFLPAEYNPNEDDVLDREDVRSLKFFEESVLTGAINTYHEPPGEYVWWKFVPPVSDFTQSAAGKAGGVGVALNERDPDQVVRRVRLTYQTDIAYPPSASASRLILQGNVENVAAPSLLLPVASYLVEVDKRRIVTDYYRQIGFVGDLNPPISIPVDQHGRMLINYTGPYGTFPRVTAADVLNGKVEAKQFDGKVVFIGVVEGEVADTHYTPYGVMPRVDITANGVATILDRAYLTQSVEDAIVPLGFLALFLAITLPFFTALGATLWAVLCVLGYGAFAWMSFTGGRGILPLVPALLLILLMWLAALAIRPFTVIRRATAVETL